MENKKHFTIEEVEKIGEELGINWSKFNIEQFRIGLDVELEHGLINSKTNVTNDDRIITGKIARAHLNEFSDYYNRLEKMEKDAESKKSKSIVKYKKIFYVIFVIGILIIIGVGLFMYFNKIKFLPIQMTKQNDVLYPDFGEIPPSIKLNKTDYQTVKLYYHNFLIGDDVIMDACDEEAVLPVRRELSLLK
ncbi:MAG: DUF5661 family protein, partial [Patescibacteria group bacterium]